MNYLKKITTMTLNNLAAQIHENNKAKGFYDDPKNIGEMLALIHSEVSEALEADREFRYAHLDNEQFSIMAGAPTDSDFNELFKEFSKDTFEDELADIIIRVLDLAAFKEIDIDAHIKAKIRYNTLRPHKHGKKY